MQRLTGREKGCKCVLLGRAHTAFAVMTSQQLRMPVLCLYKNELEKGLRALYLSTELFSTDRFKRGGSLPSVVYLQWPFEVLIDSSRPLFTQMPLIKWVKNKTVTDEGVTEETNQNVLIYIFETVKEQTIIL